MKHIIYFLFILLLISGCSKEPEPQKEAKVLFDDLPKTHLLKTDFDQLPNWNEEDYALALESFINNCRSTKTQNIYQELCIRAVESQNPKIFFAK